ncbi:NAD-dependent epimerase/dehydratase family protein [Steroidobacter cummioxidans]|uniref:NAD-dependent epimerase/dehydratase family protein n=1 Tax=Steroidobacter cummioxidans TaxID=1803913 RepID=UPI001379A57D|nr:NAD-dependent epimerase/dehydratase family protein [Steroidobacter cummioxidans]
MLILGGTGFIGPYHVRAALERGHTVSVFTRGRSSTEVPTGVEQLTGDRNRDLEAIKSREWDAVLDLATYGPAWVRTLGEALKDRVKHYTFISTVAVYQNIGGNRSSTDEKSKLVEYKEAADPFSITTLSEQYAPLKVLCEREAEQQFHGRTLIIRPGVIAGPGDTVGGFTYLAVRMEAGGEILAAGDPLMQVQIIDVRDLAEWTIQMVETGATGIFNAVGPDLPLGWAEMLGALRGATLSAVKLTWIPLSWLQEQNLKPRIDIITLFPTEFGYPGLMRMSNDKSRAKGLTFRSVCETGADTLTWFKNQPVARHAQLLGGSNLEATMQRERTILAAWSAHQSKG